MAGTPVLDGVISPADGWGSPVVVADGAAGWASGNAKNLYVTSDANYVYFAAEVNASGWMAWAFIVNTKAGGAASDSWSRKINFNHANKPDFTFRGTFGGYAEYHSWTGSAWSGSGTAIAATEYAESIVADNSNGAIEIRVPKSLIGSIETMDVQFYITGDNDDHGSFDAAPNDNNAAGWNPPTSVSTLSNYASNIPLPVKLLAFKAVKDKNTVQLNWSVTQETNIDQYDIQRSADGINFSTLQSVKARNQSFYQPSYTSTDAKPFNGINYYRLVINENGRKEFSSVVKVLMSKTGNVFTINYTPGSSTINIRLIGLETGSYALSVVNSSGQMLQSIRLEHDGADVNKAIELKGILSKGIYRVVLLDNQSRSSQAFLVQ